MRKFGCFFILVFLLNCTHLFAQGALLDQKLTFDLENVSLQTCIETIENLSNITFSYDNAILPQQNLNFFANSLRLEEVLDQFFVANGIEWAISEDIITLKKAALKFWTISGYIEDGETSERLVGVQVFDARTRAGTITNDDGFFSLRLKADSVTLIVSMLGYKLYGEKIILWQNILFTYLTALYTQRCMF